MAAHARLKNEFTEDEKYHNLKIWLDSVSAEGREFQLRSCLAPYYFYSKISEIILGTPVKFSRSRQILATSNWNFVKLLSK